VHDLRQDELGGLWSERRLLSKDEDHILFSRARVLVADDIEANRELLRRRLQRLGVTSVFEAENGAEALRAIQTANIDIVLLDIMMPVMTGFDVLEALAEDVARGQLSVIVVSALDEMNATVRAIELGAEDFLLKPIEPSLLRARLKAVIEKQTLREHRRRALMQAQLELNEARSFQMALVPPRYESGDVSVDFVLQPAREVGGDLVDHVRLADGRHLLALADVSGKGAGAAFMTARLHAVIHGLMLRHDAQAILSDISCAAQAINRILASGNSSYTFVTMVLAVFDPATGLLSLVRCGHIPPFVRRADGRVERLDEASGLPLGVDPEASYNMVQVILRSGDALLLVSDGVTEAECGNQNLFGDASVLAWLGRSPLCLDDLVASVRQHEAGEAPADDLSALLLTF